MFKRNQIVQNKAQVTVNKKNKTSSKQINQNKRGDNRKMQLPFQNPWPKSPPQDAS
jgi:hypothetical protein